MSVGLALFARAPLAGRAKTRLIPALGAAGAAEVCARLLAHALAVARAAPVDGRYLYAADGPSADWFRGNSSPAGFTLRMQSEEPDLGRRMAAASREVLGTHSRVLLMGSDLVDVRAGDLALAAHWLATDAEVVLGPVADGGYWLLGLRAPLPVDWQRLFEGIAWSSPAVYPATVARFAAGRLGWRALPLRHDIDVPADLVRHADALEMLATLRGPR